MSRIISGGIVHAEGPGAAPSTNGRGAHIWQDNDRQQTLINGQTRILRFNRILRDTDDFVVQETDWSLQAVFAGYYALWAFCQVSTAPPDNNPGRKIHLWIAVDGFPIARAEAVAQTTSFFPYVVVSAAYPLTVGQRVLAFLHNQTGANITTQICTYNVGTMPCDTPQLALWKVSD